MSLSSPSATASTEQQSTLTIDEDSQAQRDDADLLVEDVSIDGMCGVY
jgi:mycofactocin precursor